MKQIEMLGILGISYYRVWCPNCESSQKLYAPKGGICTGDGDHDPCALRNSIVWADGTGSDGVVQLERARKILEKEFDGTHNSFFAMRAIREGIVHEQG